MQQYYRPLDKIEIESKDVVGNEPLRAKICLNNADNCNQVS